jgi:K+-sensing histidine kinase KdpD
MPKKNRKLFAPAERAGTLQIENDARRFSQNQILNKLAEAVSTMLVILNPQRQIVFANMIFLDFLKTSDINQIIGKRPGEAVDCIHAYDSFGGCGTSEFCRTCGSVGAILESQSGKKSEKECRIITCANDALDFRITATPYSENGMQYTIFAIHDISHEKRRQTLERVFFHDVLNSAGGISGLSALLKEIKNPEEMLEIANSINRAAENMIDEIQTQRHLSDAERGDLEPVTFELNSLSFLTDVADLFTSHEILDKKEILIDMNAANVNIVTDPVILRRILGNMVKNALEASPPLAKVSISCIENNGFVQFSVHNNTGMDREVQLQLFKRSFSTKGRGRGIGTYSMKLFGEKYLNGKVWFESSEEKGTTFYVAVPKCLKIK